MDQNRYGPLIKLQSQRARIVQDVVAASRQDLEVKSSQIEPLLEEALHQERGRLRRIKDNWYTRSRTNEDRKLWASIQKGLLQHKAESERPELLRKVLTHYANEIAGSFNSKAYDFVIGAVPYGFNWLLNAASLKRFLPWKTEEALSRRIQVTGAVERLRKLHSQGTVLLVPTHLSNIDSLVVGYSIFLAGLPPFSYGAGLNLFSNPVLGFFMSRLGAYTVDRQKRNGAYKQVLKNYSYRILREGVHSVFFPGGGRCRSGAVESHLKLGLLGTAIDAQIDLLKSQDPKRRIYVVPMTMSYPFVLEARSLIDDFLNESGKARYLHLDSDVLPVIKSLRFIWRLLKAESNLIVRMGAPLDVFGNPVDEDGNSLGPNGTVVDPEMWLTTEGELRAEPTRDRVYTQELGKKITERYHKENTILAAHLVAFSYFEELRKNYPQLDLYRFLRLSLSQRTLPLERFYPAVEREFQRVKLLEERGELILEDDVKTKPFEEWLRAGIQSCGALHSERVMKIEDGALTTEDLTLLYYYRNRLSGYGLSYLADPEVDLRNPGRTDEKGFLV